MTEDLRGPAPDPYMQADEAYPFLPLIFQPLTVNPLLLTPSADIPDSNRYYHHPLLSPAVCAEDYVSGHTGASCWGVPYAPSEEVAYPDIGEPVRHRPLVGDWMKQEVQSASLDTSEGQKNPMSPSSTATQIMETDDSGVDPQANAQRTSPSDTSRVIPLQCLLCPKEPTFSDVSHLLTHISSKSHLACRFKLELQKKNDSAAKAKIVAFDEWYYRNQVEALLDSRMAAKKEKNTIIRGKTSVGGTKRRRSATTKPTTVDSPTALSSASEPRKMPHLQHWNTSSGRASLHLHESRDDMNMEDPNHNPAGERPVPQIPLTTSSQTARVTRSRAKKIATSDKEQADHTDITISSEVMAEAADTSEVNLTKLKGVVWPGMGLFDAATSEQKRKRNQKKDSSVLQNMITTSQSVHHDKFVWDDDFSGSPRVRDIYASPSINGSPDSQEDEAKKMKKKRARRPETVDDTTIRQTRSATRAAAVGRQRAQPSRTLEAVKLEFDSDDEDMNDETGDDIFHDGRARRSVISTGRAEPSLDHNINKLGQRQPFVLSTSNESPNGFEPRRAVLQNLGSNGLMASPTPVFKQRNHSYPAFGVKEQDSHNYHGQSSVAPPTYFGQRSFPNAAGLNPLFHPQAQNGLPAQLGTANYGQHGVPVNTLPPSNEPHQFVPGSWVSLGSYIPTHGPGTAQFDH